MKAVFCVMLGMAVYHFATNPNDVDRVVDRMQSSIHTTAATVADRTR
jgi:hypothetical protein